MAVADFEEDILTMKVSERDNTGSLYVTFCKRISAEIVQEKSIEELMELVRTRMGEEIKPIPDEMILWTGERYLGFLFAFDAVNMFVWWLLFFR
jgi:hypothetical protein